MVMIVRVFRSAVIVAAVLAVAAGPLHSEDLSLPAEVMTVDADDAPRDYDSGIRKRIEGADGESGPRVGPKNRDEEIQAGPAARERESARKRRKPVSFRVGISLGFLGVGVLGPRHVATSLYRCTFMKDSFPLGFRGGLEAVLVVRNRHFLSLGVFFEQRKVEMKIAELGIFRAILADLPLESVYYLRLTRYVLKSTVDTNYVTIPLAYRYFFYEEFFCGMTLDAAVLFQAKANYGFLSYSSSVDLRPMLSPVDFGGRLLIGVVKNRVMVEIGLGTGFLLYDRMGGERHSIYLTGMLGYLI